MSTYPITAIINGREVSTTVEARRRLADFLREDLGLRGTKVSCEVQVCGACTVLVDGRPTSSCTYLAIDVDGCAVTTIEGVSEPSPHPVQTSFAVRGAVQCGFCTPGMVLTTVALLAHIPQPTREDAIEYLDGNLCRCTGYEQILEAVLAAGRDSREATDG